MHIVGKTVMRCFALAVTLLYIAAAAGAQTPDWKTYTYPADGFSASYPLAPTVQKRDIPTDAGSVELRSYLAQDGPTALFIGVCDYGSKAAGKDPDAILQGAKTGALQNTTSHVISEKKITLGIYHGLEFESESDQAHFSARVYFVGNTLYQTLVVAPLAKPYADASRMLDSFQLIARITTN